MLNSQAQVEGCRLEVEYVISDLVTRLSCILCIGSLSSCAFLVPLFFTGLNSISSADSDAIAAILLLSIG